MSYPTLSCVAAEAAPVVEVVHALLLIAGRCVPIESGSDLQEVVESFAEIAFEEAEGDLLAASVAFVDHRGASLARGEWVRRRGELVFRVLGRFGVRSWRMVPCGASYAAVELTPAA